MKSSAELILGTRVDITTYAEAGDRIMTWAAAGLPAYVCVCNVHMVMEAYEDAELRQIINGASIVTPDGQPLVWTLRALGHADATRVYGPTLTEHLLERAEREELPVAFLGGSPVAMAEFCRVVRQRHSRLEIAFIETPIVSPVPEFDADLAARLNASAAKITFVFLGCPKQERWMGV